MIRTVTNGTLVRWLSVVLLLNVAMFLACSDDPVSDMDPEPGAPPADELELSGSVFGPAGLEAAADTDADALVASSALDVETPLAGVSVDIFELAAYADDPAGTDPLTSTTTDENGTFTVESLPNDTDFILRIGETDPALEAIVRAPDDGATVDVSSATTLAAAYYAPDIALGTLPTADDLEEAAENAASALSSFSQSEVLAALQALVSETFGAGFPDDLPPHLQLIVNALEGIDLAVCELIELETASGYPTEEITILNFAQDFGEEPWGWLYDASLDHPEEDDQVRVFVEPTSGGEGVLILPLHPEEPMEGGDASLVLFDEDEELFCPPIDVTIEPLEPAPGTFASMVDDMEALFVEAAGRFNADPDELRTQAVGDLAEDEVYLALIAGGLQVIDGPNYQNNLRARLAGDVGEPLEGEAFDLWEALAAHTGYDATFAAMADELSSGGQGGLVAQQTGVTDCLGEPRNISTPAELDCWMGVQGSFADLEGVRGSLNDLSEKILGVMVDGPISDPRVQLVASEFETLRQFTDMMADGLDSMMPSQLLPLSLEVTKSEYKEDEDEEGQWTAQALATGSDWEANVLLTLSVASPIPVGRATRKLRRSRAADDTIDSIIDKAVDDMVGKLGDLGVGDITYDQLFYGPVDVDPNREEEGAYFDWSFNILDSETGAAPFEFLDGDARWYQPAAVGSAELTVTTRGGQVFQGQEVGASQVLIAEALDIEIVTSEGDPAPNVVRVDAEDDYEVTLYAEVTNLADDSNREVEWVVEGAIGGASYTTSGMYNDAITFIADPDDGVDQYILRAEAATEAGLRSDKNPPRRTFVGITTTMEEAGDLVVEPGMDIAEPGQQIQFFAVDPDTNEPVDVTWTATIGSITDSGLFTMPSDQSVGQATITATAVDNPARTATAEVTYPCSGTLTLTSDAFTYESEWIGGRWVPDFGSPSDAFSIITNIPEFEGFNLDLALMTNISDKGTWTRDLTFTVPPPGSGQTVDAQWTLAVDDSHGRGWMPLYYDPPMDPNPSPVGSIPLTIERTLVFVDDREIPEFSGSFETPMVTYVEGDNGQTEAITTHVEGEFEGIRYGQDSCIIFRVAP